MVQNGSLKNTSSLKSDFLSWISKYQNREKQNLLRSTKPALVQIQHKTKNHENIKIRWEMVQYWQNRQKSNVDLVFVQLNLDVYLSSSKVFLLFISCFHTVGNTAVSRI